MLVAKPWYHPSSQQFPAISALPDAISPAPPGCFADISAASDRITLTNDARAAVEGADLVIADTWVSMGDEDAEYKKELLSPYQVNDELMSLAKEDAIFLHCLPAHREEEVTSSVIDGKQSVVWDEAENRLHAQKAIMLWCLGVL